MRVPPSAMVTCVSVSVVRAGSDHVPPVLTVMVELLRVSSALRATGSAVVMLKVIPLAVRRLGADQVACYFAAC